MQNRSNRQTILPNQLTPKVVDAWRVEAAFLTLTHVLVKEYKQQKIGWTNTVMMKWRKRSKDHNTDAWGTNRITYFGVCVPDVCSVYVLVEMCLVCVLTMRNRFYGSLEGGVSQFFAVVF